MADARTWMTTAAGAVALLSPGAATADDLSAHADEVMGTSVSLVIWGEEEADSAAGAVFEELARIDELMTSWEDDSDVARINEAAGEDAVEVDEEVFSLVDRAVRASRKTEGAFDITVGAFRGLWRFGEDRAEEIPDDETIEERAELVDYENIELDDDGAAIRLAESGMRVTLGGIAKGYAVDRAVSILRERDVRDFILQAGGDLYVSGQRGERAWRVGVRDPRGSRDASFAVLELEDAAFSTSGDYERGFVKDGERYHHILDPDTGHPARESRSVTVLAETALEADIWSTSLFVMGPERGLERAESEEGIEAVFVTAENDVELTSGLQGRLHILRPPTDAP